MSETCCDLNVMTTDELECLRSKVISILDERGNKEAEAFMNTEEFKCLKKEYKAVKKAAKALTKSQEFEVLLPLKFKVKMELQDLAGSLDSGYDAEIYDLFSVDVRAKVLSDGNLDKDAVDSVQGVVDQALEDVCSNVLRLNPEGWKAVENFMEVVSELRGKVQDAGVCAYDLE